jgi:hypothetical protein
MLFPADFTSPLINEDLPGQAQLVFTFYNRFSSTGWALPQSVRYRIFRLHASYLSATSHTGRQPCRVKSIYKTFLVVPACQPVRQPHVMVNFIPPVMDYELGLWRQSGPPRTVTQKEDICIYPSIPVSLPEAASDLRIQRECRKEL